MSTLSIARDLLAFAKSGRTPSRRAWASLAKLHGRRLERRWPFLPKASGADLNLGFDDILEFEYARRSRLSVLVVGAYDGVQNDPTGRFLRTHECDVVFVEPQPDAFARLKANMAGIRGSRFVNAAIDQTTGTREIFYVPEGVPELPAWTGQLASFDRNHLAKHEEQAPGLLAHITSGVIETVSFDDLINRLQLKTIDLLQIDAEGLDAALLSWFPFDRMRPGVIHYEIDHMSLGDRERTRALLRSLEYVLVPAHLDEIAVRC